MEEPLDLEPLFPDRAAGENLAVQLARRLREAIDAGALPAGARLLGTRQLAKRLGLGRNTVALAFEQLAAEGYLQPRRGSGTLVGVSGRKPERLGKSVRQAPPARAQLVASLRSTFEVARGLGPLRPGMPDLAKFPTTPWSRSARKTLNAYDGDLGYGPSSGLRALRDAIATHLRQFRGVTARADQIIVVEGAQAAMHLVAFVLARPGERVVVEDPCYALARAAFEAHELRLCPVPVDGDGLLVDALPREARLAFVTPTHQFPLGGTLPIARRTALLQWAGRKAATYIVEDDYDSEFTSRARPLPPLQCLDRDERVIYIGSSSKTLAPAVRLGYIVAPPHLVGAFSTARAITGLGCGVHVQATLADFIEQGHYARHIRRMNAMYDRRRAILVNALRPALRFGFRLGPAQTGLHLALLGKRSFNDVELSSALNGQSLVALSRLCIRRRDCRGFVLGFTNGSDAEIEAAATQLVERARVC
jgi:GntR family transcriptional regulator/MocR family aminotransferase